MAIPLLAARILKAIFQTRNILPAIVGGQVASAGTKAFTGKTISQLAGIGPTEEESESLSKQRKELRKQELFKEIRGEEISALLPQFGSVADDPIASSRDAAELQLLTSQILPFILQTGVSLEEIVGDQGGPALRALLSEKNREKLDASAIEPALSPARNITKESLLGIASSPTAAPLEGPPPPPQVRAPTPGGLQQ